MCDDFDHLQLINLCDTKIPTDDFVFSTPKKNMDKCMRYENKKTVIEKSLVQILTNK